MRRTNRQRAASGKRAARAYAKETRSDDDAQTVAGDLVADLMHYVRAEGGDPLEAVQSAVEHFEAEERGDD